MNMFNAETMGLMAVLAPILIPLIFVGFILWIKVGVDFFINKEYNLNWGNIIQRNYLGGILSLVLGYLFWPSLLLTALPFMLINITVAQIVAGFVGVYLQYKGWLRFIGIPKK